ncbi:hypothetical protein CSIRO_3059 [Bradyrhizobiaceae bacterium SG-6C]|nr:hypothetical protein CSIRO_3059 [Bradyrhizobiaceae bacterium SG-6C]
MAADKRLDRIEALMAETRDYIIQLRTEFRDIPARLRIVEDKVLKWESRGEGGWWTGRAIWAVFTGIAGLLFGKYAGH